MTKGLGKAPRTTRIAVVVPRYGLVGGGEKLVYELTERIAANQRWEIHVFANQWATDSGRVHLHHVPILAFPRFMAPLSFALSVRDQIKRLGVDLIHTHERILDAHIYSVHGIPHPIWVKQIRRKKVMGLFDHTLAHIENKLIKNPRCKHLLAVSSITAEKLKQAFENVDDRIRIISPGVDLDPFMRLNKPECRLALRQRYGWHADDIVFLFVGMNFEVKGLDLILNALGTACPANPAATLRLLVVGKGNIHRYRQMADSLGIGTQVAFTGPVRSDIERIYMGSDIFILLSRFDTFGLVVLEAMAAGLPVIISRNVGAKDVVRNNGNGFVVDTGDTAAIVDRINCLVQADSRQRMSTQALDTAGQYSWDVMADKIGSIYNGMIPPNRTGFDA